MKNVKGEISKLYMNVVILCTVIDAIIKIGLSNVQFVLKYQIVLLKYLCHDIFSYFYIILHLKKLFIILINFINQIILV